MVTIKDDTALERGRKRQRKKEKKRPSDTTQPKSFNVLVAFRSREGLSNYFYLFRLNLGAYVEERAWDHRAQRFSSKVPLCRTTAYYLGDMDRLLCISYWLRIYLELSHSTKVHFKIGHPGSMPHNN